MENEVVIHVRADGSRARRGFADIERDATRSGKLSGDNLATGLIGSMSRALVKIGAGLTAAIDTATVELQGGFADIERDAARVGKASGDNLSAGLTGSMTQTFANLSTGLSESIDAGVRGLQGGFADIEQDASRAGRSFGDKLSEGLTGSMTRTFANLSAGFSDAIGAGVGRLRGGFADIERDASRTGKAAGDNLSAGLSESMTQTFGKLGAALPAAMGTALAGTLGPMLVAALSSAVLLAMGGGVLAAGIKAAASDAKVKSAFGEFGKTAKDVFKDFGDPFREPLIRAAGTFKKVLSGLAPEINQLGVVIAPVIDRLAPALGKFLENAMPGISSAVEASVPLFNKLAEKLPAIGAALGELFESIADSGPAATKFFGVLLDTMIGLLKVLADVIGLLEPFYENGKKAFKDVGEFVEWATVKITAMIREILRAVNWLERLGKVGKAAAKAIWEAISSSFSSAKEAVSTAVRAMTNRITSIGRSTRSAANAARNSIVTAFRSARDQAVSAMRGLASRAANALQSIPRNIVVNIVQRLSTIGTTLVAGARAALGFAHGGIVGAATGGIHSGMRMVGEAGPELLDLPPGTSVKSNPDTQRLMSGGGSNELRITADVGRLQGIAQALVEAIRLEVRGQGGNVQQVLGVAGR